MKIAVLGYGVVGSGVDELLRANRELIAARAGQEIEIKYLLDLRDLQDERQAPDFDAILADDEVALVVEAMGGVEPAFSYLSAALAGGKSVVTSNKELVAERGAELIALARAHGAGFLCEASVAGGTPVLHPIYQSMAANRLQMAAGILNGTTNFILTKMIEEGMGFDKALAIAQELGYAEADPTADIEGIDACRKVCVLASLLFGRQVYPKSVHTEGITKITAADVAYAADAGCVIKLIGQTRLLEDGRVLAMVAPALIPKEQMLAGVRDVFNGVLVRGDATGDVLYYGRGAGKLPTASAVLSDVIEIARAGGFIDLMCWGESDESRLADYRDCVVTALVRAEHTTPAAVQAALGEVQVLHRDGAPADECCVLVREICEGALQEKLAALAATGAQVAPHIRLLVV